ncbi:hypothetical protein F7R14_07915 [Pseudomonas lini]|uniref:Uncharacterized protein n=1 Tax=Pseudomonas lini TaxID=163011 RepID=A0A7V7P5U4_9PSED|nr:hypothetical protein F7R14_07915 [Pseudomonas lini]
MWERACSRRGSVGRHECCLIHHLREQARSHRFRALTENGIGTIPPRDSFSVYAESRYRSSSQRRTS